MQWLCLTDIFGQVNPDLLPDGCVVVSPYAEPRHFADEQQAYQAFLAQGGLKAYLQKVLALWPPSQAVAVIGFSAGATCAWQLAQQPPANLRQCLAVYSGHLHQYLAQSVQVPTRLLLVNETHYQADVLARQLTQPLVDCQVWPYQHGFANPCSAAYHPQAVNELARWLHDGYQQVEHG